MKYETAFSVDWWIGKVEVCLICGTTITLEKGDNPHTSFHRVNKMGSVGYTVGCAVVKCPICSRDVVFSMRLVEYPS